MVCLRKFRILSTKFPCTVLQKLHIYASEKSFHFELVEEYIYRNHLRRGERNVVNF